MNKICFLATTPSVFNFFIKDHIINISKYAQVTILTSNIKYLDNIFLNNPNIKFKEMHITRKTNFFLDLILLIKIFFFLKRINFIVFIH